MKKCSLQPFSLSFTSPGRFLSVFLLALPLVCSTNAFAALGRPSIVDGTVVTDEGNLLRGPRVSLDRDRAAPTFSELESIRERGANALHVYAERKAEVVNPKDSTPPDNIGAGFVPGYKLQEVRDLVADTKALEMYLVITVGNAPGVFDHDFTIGFWDLYAAEFGDESHVIFEIQNEPLARFCPRASHPSPPAVLEMERDAYCKIREYAPDSMTLLFSYAMMSNGTEVLGDLAALQGMVLDPVAGCGLNIDWSKTGVAFHGYDFPTLRPAIQTVTAQGYGLMQTEFGPYCEGDHCGTPQGPCFGQDCTVASCSRNGIHIPQVELYEELGISWLTFLTFQSYLDDSVFKDRIDAASLLWLADFGTWPASSNPPFGSTISLFSQIGGRYVSADLGQSTSIPPLVANATAVGSEERFDVVAQGNGTVALKAQANDKFVRPQSNRRLAADSTLPIAFEWLDRPDGRLTLRAVDRKFVAADYNQGPQPPLVANRIKGGGSWEAFQWAAANVQDLCYGFGASGDQPVSGDWDGNGRDEIGVFRDGLWSLDSNGNGIWQPEADASQVWGLANDIAVPGDWNGDGKDELAVFRNGIWYLDVNGDLSWTVGVDRTFSFGVAGDQPVSGDWDGDGDDEVGIFRSGNWQLDLNDDGVWNPGTDGSFFFGIFGDQPVAGDWNSDGADEIGIFRSGSWLLDFNGNRQWDAGVDLTYGFGLSGDRGIVGQWLLGGSDHVGVFRPQFGGWSLDQTGNGAWDGC